MLGDQQSQAYTNNLTGMEPSTPRRAMGARMICATPSRGRAPKNYSLGELLGKGGYAKVYKGIDVTSGQVVAIKQIPLKEIGPVDSIMSEIELLQALDHPNIVKYLGFQRDSTMLSIVLELCANGSLSAMVKKFGSFPENLVAMYIKQVLEGLTYLHAQGVIHRDIKGDNILTTSDGQAKLADFGVATSIVRPNASGDGEQFNPGTPHFMAPEIIQGQMATTACDIWSLGVTIIQLRTGHIPYETRDAYPAMYAISESDNMPLPLEATGSLRDFLELCFVKDPTLRTSASNLLQHKWIRKHGNVSAPIDAAGAVQLLNESSRRPMHVPSRLNLRQAFADMPLSDLQKYADNDHFEDGFEMGSAVPIYSERDEHVEGKHLNLPRSIRDYVESESNMDDLADQMDSLKFAKVNLETAADPFEGLMSLEDERGELQMAAQSEAEQICSAIVSGSEHELAIKYARLLELVKAEPAVKKQIMAVDHLDKTLSLLGSNKNLDVPILNLIHLLLAGDTSCIESFSIAGGLREILNKASAQNLWVGKIVRDVCLDYSFGARLLASSDESLKFLCNQIGPDSEVLSLAAECLMAIFDQFGPRKRAELWQQLGRFELLRRIVTELEPLHIQGDTGRFGRNILYELLTSFFRTPAHVVKRYCDKHILRHLMRTYRHLDILAEERLLILHIFKDASSIPSVIEAMEAGNLERYFVDILRRSSQRTNAHAVASCVLPILYNYCRLSARRQYLVARVGLISLLVEIPNTEPALKEFALSTLCSMAHVRKCWPFLWREGGMGAVISLTAEVGYEATAMAALAAWLGGEPTPVVKALLGSEFATYVSRALKNGRAETYAMVVSALFTMMQRHADLAASLPVGPIYNALSSQLSPVLPEPASLVSTLQLVLCVMEAQPAGASASLSDSGLATVIKSQLHNMPELAQRLGQQILA